MTAVANTAFTAADFNKFVRDNLLCTAPALATTPGSYFCVDSPGSISERQVNSQIVLTSQSTSSLPWTDLATVGPTVTVQTNTVALCFYTASAANATLNEQAGVNIQITGASNISPLDTPAYWQNAKPTGQGEQSMGVFLYENLTPGSNTFTMKYRAWTAGIATFSKRQIAVLPL